MIGGYPASCKEKEGETACQVRVEITIYVGTIWNRREVIGKIWPKMGELYSEIA